MAFDLGEAILTLKTSSEQLVSGLAEGEDASKEFADKSNEQAEQVQKGWQESFDLTKIAMAALSVEGFRKLIEVAGEMVRAFAEDERAELRMNAALESTGSLIPHNREEIEKMSVAFQTLTGTSDDAANGMLTLLLATGRTDDQIKDLLDAANSLSIATGIDLESALTQLNKTFSGSIGRLGQTTPALKDLTEEQLRNGDAVKIVIEQYGNLNKTLEHSTDVSIKNFTNAWGMVSAAFGKVIDEGISPIREGLTGVANEILDLNSPLNAFATGFNNLVEVGKQLVLSLVGKGNVFEAIKKIADTAKDALNDQTQAVKDVIAEQKNFWTIMDAVKASAAGAKVRAAALEIEATRIRKEEADKQKKIAEDLQKGIDFVNQQTADAHRKVMEERSKAYAKMFADQAAAAKKSDEDETKNAKAAADLRNKLIIDGMKETEAAEKAINDRETKNAKESADLRAKLIIDAEKEKQAKLDKERDDAAQREKERQDYIVGIAVGAAKSISVSIGQQLAAGELSWKGLGEAAVHAIGKIVSAMGDQLAAAAAADIIKAIAATVSIVGAWAAPGLYSAAAIEGAGAVAAWATGAALENVSFSEGADFIVPPGFDNDTFPMRVESGEHVQVTPANQSSGSDIPQQVSISLDGAVFAKWLQKASKNQEIIIHAGAIVR